MQLEFLSKTAFNDYKDKTQAMEDKQDQINKKLGSFIKDLH